MAKAKSATKTDEADMGMIAADLKAEIAGWLTHLRSERRLSPKTLEAYERDLRQCKNLPLSRPLMCAPSWPHGAPTISADAR
jgi:hypothetical protein